MVLDLSVIDKATENSGRHKEAAGSIVQLVKQPKFLLPCVQDPDGFSRDVNRFIEVRHGTTTLGFIFQGGVLLAVDSRSTMGSFVASQSVDKVMGLTDTMVATVAGAAGDCQFWLRYLKMKTRLYELENGKKISVRAASKILARICYQYRHMRFSMGILVAGWDNDGPGLYWVDNDAHRTRGTSFSIGSGSTFAYGVMDTGYRWDMSVEEAIELGKRSIYHATVRDSGSGGVVTVYHITKDKATRISGDDVDSLKAEYSKYASQPSLD